MQDKVDMFEFLRHVDDSDFGYFDNLNDARKKSLSLFVAARWLSCTKNARQIVAVNSLVNSFLYKFISKHPSLLYKLMLIASSGTQKQYRWVQKKKKQSIKPETTKIISQYYGISTRQAEDYIRSFSLDDAIECASSLGAEDATLKKIKNEFK